jgi:hypothetical protein
MVTPRRYDYVEYGMGCCLVFATPLLIRFLAQQEEGIFEEEAQEHFLSWEPEQKKRVAMDGLANDS